MFCLIFRLNMNSDVRARNSIPELILDPVANVVSFGHGHSRRHYKMKLNERHRTCVARLQIMRFDSAIRLFRDAVPDNSERRRFNSLIH